MLQKRIVIAAVACTLSLYAQLPAGSGEAPAETTPADVRSTPRGAVFGFLQATREGDYRRAASFIDARGGRRGTEASQLASQLKDILDRKLSRDPALLNNTPDGDLTDGLDPKYELLGTAKFDSRSVDLLLERIERTEGGSIWLISSGTVGMIPALHQDLENTWIEQRLPAWLLARGPLDSALWQWFGLAVLLVFALALAPLLAAVVPLILGPIVRRTPTDIDDTLISSLTKPARMIFALALFRAGIVWLALPVLLRSYVGRILTALGYLAVAWMVMRIIDVVAQKIVLRMAGRHRASASSVIPLIRRTAKVGALVIAILATLATWGYNTTAILAGLGVGGLAVALAAQKTIENLFGGVAIATDKPVLVGDFCRYGDKLGTVEDVGLRSTRIRTLERTVVTIPNGAFSGYEIENFGRRDKIWLHPILKLRLDTTPAQVRGLIPALRDILLKHPKVDPSPARVRFIGISEYSFDLEIFAYVLTSDFDEYLVIQEEILLAFLDAVERAGTALAVPAQMTVLARDRKRPGMSST